MNLEAVMDELGTRLDTITGLRVHNQPPESLTPPAGFVGYPESVEYDQTYGRGTDKITLPVVIVEKLTPARAVRKRLTDYVAGSGAKSVKLILETGTYTTFHVITVQRVEFDAVTIAGVDMLAAVFTCDIQGSGS